MEYNFPRLPVSAYIPARRTKNRDEFLYTLVILLNEKT